MVRLSSRSAAGLIWLTLSCTCDLARPAEIASEVPVKVEHVSVFVSGEGDYHTYRIPSVILAQDGSLLAFCEGRKSGRGDSGDIDLVLKRSNDAGRTWGELEVLWNDGPNTCGNPCPVMDRESGRIILLLTHNFGDDSEAEIKRRTGRGSRTVWVMESNDHGRSWSEPFEITASAKDPKWGWYATGPGVGIQIQNGPHAGRLVIPCDHSFHDPNGSRQDVQSEYGAHVIYSDDRGASWNRGAAIVPKMNECQVAELASPAGSLVLDMRSYRGKSCRAQSISTDGGATWSEPKDVPELVEPVCQASLIRFGKATDEGSFLCFSNPADPKRRINLTVKASSNDGKTWSDGVSLNAGAAAYSCLVQLSNEMIGCLYERGNQSAYEEITFARFPVELVREQ